LFNKIIGLADSLTHHFGRRRLVSLDHLFEIVPGIIDGRSAALIAIIISIFVRGELALTGVIAISEES